MKNIKYLIVFTVIYFTRYHLKSSELYWKIKESYFSENFSVWLFFQILLQKIKLLNMQTVRNNSYF